MPYNTNTLTPKVTLGNGNTKTISIYPNEAFIDENGYVRLISMTFNDGTVGNFKLLPKNTLKSDALNFCADFLVPFGISLAGNKLIRKGNIVVNLLGFFVEQYSGSQIQNYIKEIDMRDHAYYEINTGECVITHHIKV